MMELSKYPRAIYRAQDDKAVRVQLCFEGEQDHVFYCISLRIPKEKLREQFGGHTAAGEPQVPE